MEAASVAIAGKQKVTNKRKQRKQRERRIVRLFNEPTSPLLSPPANRAKGKKLAMSSDDSDVHMAVAATSDF